MTQTMTVMTVRFQYRHGKNNSMRRRHDGMTVMTVGSYLDNMRERKEREPPEWRGIVSFCGNKENTVMTVIPSWHPSHDSDFGHDGTMTQRGIYDGTLFELSQLSAAA